MAETRIRLMSAADIPAVAVLSGDLGYPCEAATMAKRYAAVRAAPDNEIWVAERDGQVVGWAHAHGGHLLEADSYVEIGGLVVSPACRGQGVGRRLLAACEQWARTKGYARIRLRSGSQRLDAHAFYRRVGYQDVKTSLTFHLDLSQA